MNSENELTRAHHIRHEGIRLENEGRLTEALSKYDECLGLYRKYSTEDDLNYANAVRYSAAIRQPLGMIEEAVQLWEEAVERYGKLGIEDGVIEGRRRLGAMLRTRDEKPGV